MNQTDISTMPHDDANMAARVRGHDWSATALGPELSWPTSLHSALGTLLALPSPALLLWGEQQSIFYNDACAKLLGKTFPDPLGRSYPLHWPSAWKLAAPLHAGIVKRTSGIVSGQPLAVHRAGKLQQALYSIAFCPVAGADGGPGGMLLMLQDEPQDTLYFKLQHGRQEVPGQADANAVLHANRMQVLDEVFRHSPSFVHVLRGASHVIEFANEAYFRLVGRHGLLGRPLFDAVPELASAGYEAMLAGVHASGQPFIGREQSVMVAHASSGAIEERFLDLVYLPLADATGRNAWLLGYGVDVTEKTRARHLAEQQLRDSEARLSAIFSKAAAGLSELSLDGRFLRVNDTLCQMLERSRDEMLGASITEMTHPDDISRSSEAIGRLLAIGGPVALDKRYLKPDGGIVYCNSALTRLDDGDGQPRSLLAVTIDLTQRQQAEMALRESEAFHRYAAEAGGIGKWEIDLASGKVDMSPQMAALLGFSREQRMTSSAEWASIVLPEDLPALTHAMEAATMADAQMELELRVVDPGSKERRWLHVRGGVVRDSAGRSTRLHGVALDITGRKEAEAALRASEERYRTLTEMSPDATLVSVDNCIVYANPAAVVMLGASSVSQLAGHSPLVFIEPEFHAAARQNMGGAPLPGDSPPLLQQHWRRLDGVAVTVQVSTGAISWEGRSATQVLLRDITEQQRIQDALRISNERLKLAIEGSGEGIWDWDIRKNCYQFSDSLKRMLAWTPADESPDGVIKALRQRIHVDDLPRIRAALLAYVEGRESSYNCEFRVQRADGVWLWLQARGIIVARDDNGLPLLMTGTTSDISARKQAEERIWHHANFDALTGLPNRRLFRDRLDQEVRKAARSGLQVALLFIDLDRFKQVNDLLGHDAGDLLLAQCANRIKGCVRDSDTVARLGGDEFTVILSAPESPVRIEHVCQKILHTLESPFPIGKEVVYMSGSIGVTIYPNDATTSEELIRKADQAMYAAKNAGKNQFSYFTYAMDENAHSRLRLASELRSALPAKQLEVYYQPVLDLASGRLVKAEALLRWHHPRLGLVEPASFIPLAEETGQINRIGTWVFKEAASRSLQWGERLGEGFQISVNKSPIQFLSHNDDADWLQHLRRLGLPGSSIAIEITESMLLHASASVTGKLLGYRDAGIQVAIDDFGTGYSSMAYLKKFDIDYLKIDQSFVAEIATDDSSRAIAESIIVMAHKLGLKVIAEGIETGAQLDLLRQAGCDYGQGYLFCAALPAPEFEELLVAARAGQAAWRGLFQASGPG